MTDTDSQPPAALGDQGDLVTVQLRREDAAQLCRTWYSGTPRTPEATHAAERAISAIDLALGGDPDHRDAVLEAIEVALAAAARRGAAEVPDPATAREGVLQRLAELDDDAPESWHQPDAIQDGLGPVAPAAALQALEELCAEDSKHAEKRRVDGSKWKSEVRITGRGRQALDEETTGADQSDAP